MSETLRAGRPAAAELARILRAQIRAARGFLPSRRPATDEDIHELRRAVKRARATLRLLRPALRRPAFHAVDRRLRDAARQLNDVRDARVLLDALDRLVSAEPELVHHPAVLSLRRRLHHERSLALAKVGVRSVPAARVRRSLGELDARVRALRLSTAVTDIGARALERLHRKARHAAARARKARTDALLHAWRKRVKHEGYALAVLAGGAEGRMAAAVEVSERIGHHLGEDHDLALLDARLRAMNDRGARPAALRRGLRARRQALQRRAFNLGQMLFDRKPRAFVADLQR